MKQTRDYKRQGKFTRFTVYDNKTDMPIIVCGTALQCANVMGIAVNTFYNFATDNDSDLKKKRYGNRWTVIREELTESELDEYNRR